MIAAQCPKCKSIGCNNNNSICNNWGEIITLKDSHTIIETQSNLYELPKIAEKEIKTEYLKQKIKELQRWNYISRFSEDFDGMKKSEDGEFVLWEDVLKLLGE